MKRRFLQATLLLLLSATGFSQGNEYWSPNRQNPAEITTDKSVRRQTFPREFSLFDLDLGLLRQSLFTITDRSGSVIISLPNVSGAMEQFEVFEASNFEPGLQARFPDIRAFSGKGISDPSATLKLSFSPGGIQAMVFRTDAENEFIEPYSADHHTYAVFNSYREKGKLPWKCTTEEKLAIGLDGKVKALNVTARSGGDLKTMRLAQSVTAEYSNYFGATSSSQVSLVMTAINNTLTRCNGVYEKDLALHLNLVSNTTSVIYYNPSTDPYSPASSGAGGAWNSELQNTLTSVIGEANYDVGHLFGASGGGGNAGCIGCVCTNGSKGSGYTSPADGVPQGDNFDIDYVVHEIGHQLGGNHTFSHSNEGTGVNKEPGSGITIMGYAGITSQDMAPHSYDFYHQATIGQIQTNLGSKTCPVTTSITATNSTPVVAALTNYTIPKSTPFALTGSATDANSGDVLTYCWEQNDNASTSQTGTNSVASPTKASGPNWISFRPTTSTVRYFPQLSTILAGGTVTGPMSGGDAGANSEALSSVARTLNFRLTVRDNAVYSTSPASVGQTNYANMVVTVSSASGPFTVTSPNTAVSWTGGSSQAITWNVASTTASPVSCANVKISLSTDGGQTFPTVLVSSTPNDGTETVVIPNTATTTARIKVEAVGNIFFDIGNTNFTITSGSSCAAPTSLASSAITTSSATVSWAAVTGAQSYSVDYKTSAASTWTNAGSAITTTSVGLSGLSSSTVYDWRVRTNCSASSSSYATAQFTTAAAACNTPSGLSSSAITSSSATVSWTAVSGAISYAVDYKTSASSTWTNAASATTATSIGLSGLAASTVYDWRVRTNCSGSSSSYATAQFTTSAGSTCATAFEPNETQSAAAAISSGVTNSAAISSTTDIDYFKITTTATSNITYNLVGPSGVDFDLHIYNSAGTQIGSGTSASATETVSLSNQAAGTYYIRVIGYNGANSTTCYTIKATATAVTGCQSSYDVSTNGTTSGAASIPFNTNITGLISPSGDLDYYKFVITTGGSITVTLGTLPADYDLKLFNSAGTQVGISQNGSTTSETINYTAAAGTYYAQVYGYNGANSSSTCYTLKVQLGTATRDGGAKAPVVSIYPNPVRSQFKVDMGGYTEPVSITVTDMYGRRVATQKFSGATSVATARLASGVYTVTVTNSEGVILEQSRIVKE